MLPNKACPVVLSSSLPVRLLLFRYPSADTQLMKGTIENGETTREAALRELTEESGIDDAMVEIDLGYWNAEHQDQIWSFHLCRVGRRLPERWAHQQWMTTVMCSSSSGLRKMIRCSVARYRQPVCTAVALRPRWHGLA